MSVNKLLLKMAEELESPENEVIQQADDDDMVVVAIGLVDAANALRETAAQVQGDSFDNVNCALSPESLEEMAAIATAFDESEDPLLQKQASVLDEILLTISSPSGVVNRFKAAQDEEIDKLRARYRAEQQERLYNDAREQHEKQNKAAETRKAVKEQVKAYQPLEAPLSTRYCPDHAGASVIRIGEYTYQCPMDKKVYNYEAGYRTMKGDDVPGGSVQAQTIEGGNYDVGHLMFDTRDSMLGRSASTEKKQIVKKAQEAKVTAWLRASDGTERLFDADSEEEARRRVEEVYIHPIWTGPTRAVTTDGAVITLEPHSSERDAGNVYLDGQQGWDFVFETGMFVEEAAAKLPEPEAAEQQMEGFLKNQLKLRGIDPYGGDRNIYAGDLKSIAEEARKGGEDWALALAQELEEAAELA